MVAHWIRGLATLIFLPLLAQTSSEKIMLWPTGSGQTRQGPSVVMTTQGKVTQVNAPFLTLYSPKTFNGKTVLIAAGGGYRRIEQAKEALPAAQFLTQHGFRAYILTYRLPNSHWPEGKDVAMKDVRQALTLIHQDNPYLSVLGFSAGAHLLALAINRAEMTPKDDKAPLAVEGMALIYPIVSVEPPFNHSATHRVLAGRHASRQEEAKWSVQHAIHDHSPPLFVVESEDDPIAPPQNGLLLHRAATQHHVPMTWIRYATGGHGFGLGRKGLANSAWPEHYLSWLNQLPAHNCRGN
ncbi:Acetyl esterase/lipase [Rosenbergiella nectarea]|uniref:Acetyl esterase/lipase n=1 Tax=Rosenbergiella nectarea TaxID=988801 RepID=A0A1H9MKN7_9GAMM|nr:alpha/beta hydrolase [Rosenbergiella nectarea]SER24178.1 Acetyl esterase/lipase [Rosenbergiella nectarea]